MDGRRFARLVLPAALALVFIGCEATEDTPTTPSSSSVDIQITSDPTVVYNAATGKTTAIVQFIARDKAGNPLSPDDVVVELLVDNAAVDNESILQADSEELSSSIHFGMVLDASYSMLQHTPPAFAPMLAAARNAVLEGLALYADRPGTFTWNVSWFSETISAPAPQGRTWQPDDLLTIPEPGGGQSTKLFAAVDRHAGKMLDAYATIANGPHDHHVMIVLSDGADNYSWFNNASFASSGVTTSGAPYDVTGWAAATLDSAVAAIEAHPNLTVHALGLGSAVQDAQLQALATAGGGRYLKNPSSAELEELFASVTQEFATIQDHGATIPLQPDDYQFTLRVLTKDRRAKDEYKFDFHAGDEGAGVLP